MKYYGAKLSENMSETPEGFLICHDVSIARTGEQEYGPGETPVEAGPNGKVLVSRSEQEVFRPETIASFEGKSVTIQHPTQFVDPKNYKELEKGSVQNVRRGKGDLKDDLIADLLIKDAAAIALVKAGLREVSCGYEAEYEETAPGKANQLNIIGNHVALVEKGRAGSSYAINDHKGDDKMKLDKIKADVKKLFGKAQDDAMKVIDAGGAEVTAENENAEVRGKGYDELVETVKDLADKVDAMKPKGKDAESEASGGQGAKKVKPAIAGGKDEDKDKEKSEDEGEDDMGARLKKLEMIVEKLCSKMGDEYDEESEESEDEESEESEDADSEDDDFEESHMTGDTAARAEILAPGIGKSKDIKSKALQAAYGTKDGKAIIEALSGGKKPDFKSAKTVDALFISASEVLKVQRTGKLAKTKVTDYQPSLREGDDVMTAEKMNEINAKHWNQK